MLSDSSTMLMASSRSSGCPSAAAGARVRSAAVRRARSAPRARVVPPPPPDRGANQSEHRTLRVRSATPAPARVGLASRLAETPAQRTTPHSCLRRNDGGGGRNDGGGGRNGGGGGRNGEGGGRNGEGGGRNGEGAQAGTAAGSVIPAPPSRHSCAGRNPRTHAPSPSSSPIHPSPLLGGRLGGGCGAPSDHQRSSTPRATTSDRPRPNRHTAHHPNRRSAHRPIRHSCAPPSSFLRRQEPAHARTPSPPSSPIHPSPLLGVSCKMPNFGGSADQALSGRHPRAGPRSAILQETPFRGEVRWGVRRPKRPPAIVPAPPPSVIPASPSRHSCALPVIPAQAGTRAPVPACAGMTEREWQE